MQRFSWSLRGQFGLGVLLGVGLGGGLTACESDAPPAPTVEVRNDSGQPATEPAPTEAKPAQAKLDPVEPEPTQAERLPRAPVVGIDSLVTTSGLPQHLRFALSNTGDAASSIELHGIDLRPEAGGEPVSVKLHELQLWSKGVDTPTLAAPGEPLIVAAGAQIELLIYLESWTGDPRAQHYDFNGNFSVDGETLAVPLTVRRARREPMRRESP